MKHNTDFTFKIPLRTLSYVARCLEGTVGVQGRPPQDVPQWPIDYYELGQPERQLAQEGSADLLL